MFNTYKQKSRFAGMVIATSLVAGHGANAGISVLQESYIDSKPKSVSVLDASFVELSQKTIKGTVDRAPLIMDAAELAAAAYNKPEAKDLRNELLSRPIKPVKPGQEKDIIPQIKEMKEFSANIPGYGTSPAGFVAYDPEMNRMIVAYHGTEGDLSDVDWQTNLEGGGFVQVKNPYGEGAFHAGFYNRFQQSQAAMKDLFNDMVKRHDLKKDGLEVLVTGHSLGGALASVSAYAMQKDIAPEAKVRAVTFSAPRAFDQKAAEDFENSLGARAVRIYNDGDIVPMVALGAQGYKHVGQKVATEGHGYLNIANHWMDDLVNKAQSPAKVTLVERDGFVTKAKSAFSSIKEVVSKPFSAIKSLASRVGQFFWGN